MRQCLECNYNVECAADCGDLKSPKNGNDIIVINHYRQNFFQKKTTIQVPFLRLSRSFHFKFISLGNKQYVHGKMLILKGNNFWKIRTGLSNLV